MDTQNKYRFEQVNTSHVDLASVFRLFEKSFGNTNLTNDALKWQYDENPLGKVVGYNAYHGDQLAAHYVTIPTQAWRSGTLTSGLLSINTATHPEHQKKGLFTKLAELTYSLGRELGYSFVVGVANQNSVHGFTRKLGFQLVGELERRFVFSPIAQGDLSNLDFAGAWNYDRVAWRLANPSHRYSARKVGENWHILGRTERFPALIGEIPADSLPKSVAVTGRSLWPSQWIGLDPQIDWHKTLNLLVPARFRPIPLNLIYRDLLGHEILDPKSVKFWAMEFDAY
jgi:GNAT superfamily N-acetyltransferase